MTDLSLRTLERKALGGDRAGYARALRRAGLCEVRVWDGRGYGYGHGYGHGHGYGRGHGHGYGYGYGHGHGGGHGDGRGHGYGYGYGYGDGKATKESAGVQYSEVIEIGSPVVVRSYVSGVMVGRLAGGDSGTVVLTDWRFLRRWRGEGNEGSVYALIQGDQVPYERGPLMACVHVVNQADVMAVSEECYRRLAGD